MVKGMGDLAGEVQDLVPAGMLREFAYCPRLCYIQWVQGEFCDSADTVEGRFQHRQVDARSDAGPEDLSLDSADDSKTESYDHENIHARSVFLFGPKTGVTCIVDLLEGTGRTVTPVDYKKGKTPKIPEGAYEPELVQLCAQGLVLRENCFDCSEGIIYFVGSKERIRITFDGDLERRTRNLICSLRDTVAKKKLPLPLEDSPKCNRCSLAGICMPDEVNFLRKIERDTDLEGTTGAETSCAKGGNIRRLLPARDDEISVYVIGQGNTVRKKGDRLEVWSKDGRVSEARLREISQVCLYGGVGITTPALVSLLQRGIPVCYFSVGGWFYGFSQGMTHKNVELRILQFGRAADKDRSLEIARYLISGKIKNCRTLLRRNDPEAAKSVLNNLAGLGKAAEAADNAESLLGIEGAAAEAYFSRFGHLLKDISGFSFQNRNKRPPKDPVNAVLSYLYTLLVKDLFVVLLSVGFDPYLGFYHRPRYGRPALALDMMEEFRPLVADSTTITLFNTGELSSKDFIRTGLGITLTAKGKNAVVGGYERRMDTEITHPLFGYTVSYRRVLEVQARLLARVLYGEIEVYKPFCTR